MPACIRTDVDEIVGSTHDFLVVLHHDDGIAQRLQFLQYMNESGGVAAMQADAGFVEDVERAYERRSE